MPLPSLKGLHPMFHPRREGLDRTLCFPCKVALDPPTPWGRQSNVSLNQSRACIALRRRGRRLVSLVAPLQSIRSIEGCGAWGGGAVRWYRAHLVARKDFRLPVLISHASAAGSTASEYAASAVDALVSGTLHMYVAR